MTLGIGLYPGMFLPLLPTLLLLRLLLHKSRMTVGPGELG